MVSGLHELKKLYDRDMESKRTGRNPDNAYLTILVGAIILKRFDVERIYPNKAKSEIVKILTLFGPSIWSLANMIKFILGYLEYLDTDEGDRSLQEYSTYNGSWFPWI